MTDISTPDVNAGIDVGAPAVDQPPADVNINLPNFKKIVSATASGPIDLLRDVDLNVKIELGRTRIRSSDYNPRSARSTSSHRKSLGV